MRENVDKDRWPICAKCEKAVDDFWHEINLFTDDQGIGWNAYVAVCHNDKQADSYDPRNKPSLEFGKAFAGNTFLKRQGES